MNILVLGGTHGNELLGIELVRSLGQNPIDGVDALMANPPAVAQAVRFVESDLNRSFGNQPNDTWERRRAKELTEVFTKYDIVLDFHNTQTPQNNCCFTGVNTQAELYSVAARLGFTRVIQATYECMNKYAPNVLSIEVSVGDSKDSVEYWRREIAQMVSMSSKRVRLPDVYRYSRRVTWQERDELGIEKWRPFLPVRATIAQKLHVSEQAVPIFIGSRFTEFYATLLEPVDTKRLPLQITDKDDSITTL